MFERGMDACNGKRKGKHLGGAVFENLLRCSLSIGNRQADAPPGISLIHRYRK